MGTGQAPPASEAIMMVELPFGAGVQEVVGQDCEVFTGLQPRIACLLVRRFEDTGGSGVKDRHVAADGQCSSEHWHAGHSFCMVVRRHRREKYERLQSNTWL